MFDRSPYAPMRLPASAFEEIEPLTREDGSIARRFRVKLTGRIATQVQQDVIRSELTERKPLETSKSLLFYQEYKYGNESDEHT